MLASFVLTKVVLFFCIKMSECENTSVPIIRETNIRRYSFLDNKIPDEYLWQENSKSRIDCFIQCKNDSRCNTLFVTRTESSSPFICTVSDFFPEDPGMVAILKESNKTVGYVDKGYVPTTTLPTTTVIPTTIPPTTAKAFLTTTRPPSQVGESG